MCAPRDKAFVKAMLLPLPLLLWLLIGLTLLITSPTLSHAQNGGFEAGKVKYFQAQATTVNSIDFRWLPPDGDIDIDHYQLHSSPTPDFSSTDLRIQIDAFTPNSPATYHHPLLPEHLAHNFRVRAKIIRANGDMYDGMWSDPIKVTGYTDVPPTAVRNLTAIYQQDDARGTILLTWNRPEVIGFSNLRPYYDVYRQRGSESPELFLGDIPLGESTLFDHGVPPGITHVFEVQTVVPSSGGETVVASATVTITPPNRSRSTQRQTPRSE